jgi:hypothetical protein
MCTRMKDRFSRSPTSIIHHVNHPIHHPLSIMSIIPSIIHHPSSFILHHSSSIGHQSISHLWRISLIYPWHRCHQVLVYQKEEKGTMAAKRTMTILKVSIVAAVILVLLMRAATRKLSCSVDVELERATSSPPTSPSSPLLGIPSTISIRSIGDPIPVWNSVDTFKECHLIDVPDIPARAFVANITNGGNNYVIQMVCGAVGYHEMHGPSILNQTRSCHVAWNATRDRDPSKFAANEFIDSTVRFDNGTVVALIHTEFPGDRYNACHVATATMEKGWNNEQQQRYPRRHIHFQRSGPLTYPNCWVVTIGLGISYDWGHSWQHIDNPPHHLVAAVPYTYNESYMAYGWGDPSNIVLNPNDGYYYATVWNRNQVGLQPPGICVIRTNDLMNPKTWRAWNGSQFVVRFVDPYRHAPQSKAFDPKDHVCATLDIQGATKEDCNIFGLLWSHDLRQFIGTVGCSTDDEKQNAFFFTTSHDLTHWSPIREMFNRKQDLPPKVAAVTTSIHYPTLLDPTAFLNHGDANFDSIGIRPALFWTGTGHSPFKDGRHLWATPMQVYLEDAAQTSFPKLIKQDS